jgi:hypothetical protein
MTSGLHLVLNDSATGLFNDPVTTAFKLQEE